MGKNVQSNKKRYNLNKKGNNKIILLILALTFVVIPLVSLVVTLIQLYYNPYF